MLFKRAFPVALTIAFAWLILISYFYLPLDPDSPDAAKLLNVRGVLVEWAVNLAAFALVLGFGNLIGIHARRIRSGESVLYSVVLIGGALFTLGLWIAHILSVMAEQQVPLTVAMQDPGFLVRAFDWIIAPLQSGLGILLAFVLAIAGFRAVQVRRSVGMVLFVATAIVVALTQPVVPLLDILGPFRAVVIDPITTGSLRGLALGVALGSLAFGLRIIVGADKPQGD